MLFNRPNVTCTFMYIRSVLQELVATPRSGRTLLSPNLHTAASHSGYHWKCAMTVYIVLATGSRFYVKDKGCAEWVVRMFLVCVSTCVSVSILHQNFKEIGGLQKNLHTMMGIFLSLFSKTDLFR